jgi:RHS Repeat
LQRDFSWDADGYLQEQRLRKDSAVLGEQFFRYDSIGNLIECRDSRRGSTALSYDPLGRLASYVAPSGRALLQAQELEQGPLAGAGDAAMGWQSEDATYEFDAAGNLPLRRNRQGETRLSETPIVASSE